MRNKDRNIFNYLEIFLVVCLALRAIWWIIDHDTAHTLLDNVCQIAFLLLVILICFDIARHKSSKFRGSKRLLIGGLITLALLTLVTVASAFVYDKVLQHSAHERYKTALIQCKAQPVAITESTDFDHVTRYIITTANSSNYKKVTSYSILDWDNFYAYTCTVKQAKELLNNSRNEVLVQDR